MSITAGRSAGFLGIPFSFPCLPGVKVLFTTREQGNFSLDVGSPEFLEEAGRLRARLRKELSLNSWVELHQVHGKTLLVEPEATDPDRAGYLEADGACTERENHALLVKTADCQPILLAHTSGKYVAALHVGWRGNAIEFPVSGVHDFCEKYGLRPEDVLAVRGPSLGPGRSEFANYREEWPKAFHHLVQKDKTIDLWALTREQLDAAGIPPENIFGLDLCSASLPGFLYSYRNKDEARQVALIWIEKR